MPYSDLYNKDFISHSNHAGVLTMTNVILLVTRCRESVKRWIDVLEGRHIYGSVVHFYKELRNAFESRSNHVRSEDTSKKTTQKKDR